MPHSGQYMRRSVEPLELGRQLQRRAAMREDLRELLDVARGEGLGLLPVAVAQARHDLRAQQVDLTMQDAPPEGDLPLALRALVNALAQLVVGQVPGVAGIELGRQRLV